jgi:hypothetical protein
MAGYSRERNMSTNRPCGKEVRAGRRLIGEGGQLTMLRSRSGVFEKKSLQSLEPSPSRTRRDPSNH